MGKNGLTVTAPAGATFGLYPGVPSGRAYFSAIDPSNALSPTEVSTQDGITSYYYADLEAGIYHCATSMEGFNALCQVINYTQPMELDMKLDKLAGNGYEAGFVMLNTPEFIRDQLTSAKDAWGPEYEKLFRTPQFTRTEGGRHQQTTNEEMMAFIRGLESENMYVFSLGKSPMYGYEMPLVLFTRENVKGLTLEQAAEVIRNNGKPTVQYNAQCHSSEPASTEGALAMMLQLCGDYGKQVLDAVDVYIIPRINLDGAFHAIRQSPTTKEDMNRDYLYTHNKEIQTVIGAYNLFKPEVCIDGHERFHSFRITDTNICTDMELQTGAGALNHPAEMTALVMKMALQALGKCRDLGLRGHFYGKHASAAGGVAGSSYFGTRNSLSFLVETPGQINMGMCCMERRVLAQYILASTVIDYTAEHAREIMDTVHSSREYMLRTGPVYDENDLMVLEHEYEKTGSWSVPLIHVPTGKVVDPDYTIDYFEHTKIQLSRPRATAYVIPTGLEHEQEILRLAENHALEHYTLPAGSKIALQQYVQTQDGITLTPEQTVCFDKDAIVFPNTVDSTILCVIMEPDFNPSNPDRKMTLLRMGFMAADQNGNLPLYRYCHDLTNGKI